MYYVNREFLLQLLFKPLLLHVDESRTSQCRRCGEYCQQMR